MASVFDSENNKIGQRVKYNGKYLYVFDTLELEAGVTETDAPEGSFAIVREGASSATVYVANGGVWDSYDIPGVALLKALASDVNTGTNNAKYITPKALADSEYVKASDLSGNFTLEDFIALVESLDETEILVPNGKLQILEDAILVANAGTEEVNGIYTLRGVNDGKPYYKLSESSDPVISAIFWSEAGGRWYINDSEGSAMYQADEDTATPDLAEIWTVSNGISSAPNVSLTQIINLVGVDKFVPVSPAEQAVAIAPDDTFYVRQNKIIVLGAGDEIVDNTYEYSGQNLGYPFYNLAGTDPYVSSCVADNHTHGDSESTIYACIINAEGERIYESANSIEDYPGGFLEAITHLSTITRPRDEPPPTVTAVPSLKSVLPWQIVGCKVYRALLTQSGTGDPVATVLQNDLGGEVVWTRNGVGGYSGTLADAFAGTVAPISQTIFNDGAGAFHAVQGGKVNGEVFSLNTYHSSDLTQASDDVLTNTLITILVYP